LDDTDVPFDWDHISPNSLVKNKKYVPRPLKDIYQWPGNIRAWPYQLNRGDQDSLPAAKFSINQKQKEILRNSLSGLSNREIKKYLLESSFCKKEWAHLDENWIGDYKKINGKNWQPVYSLILDRWIAMYKEISKELCLSQLVCRRSKPL
jgi:hypothetical protein